MSNRGMAVSFFFISTLLFCTRYLVASIYLSTETSKTKELFNQGLSLTGNTLLILSIIALIIGVVYLIWDRITSPK